MGCDQDYEHSDQIDQIAKAMSKAQGEMTHASKDKKNPFYGSRYADLASCLEAVRSPLCNAGLSIVQLPSTTPEGKVTVRTILMHESGQWLGSVLQMNVVREKKGEGFIEAVDPQAMGSAITYARRYALAAVCGIAQADDDANEAAAKESTPKKSAKELMREAAAKAKGSTDTAAVSTALCSEPTATSTSTTTATTTIANDPPFDPADATKAAEPPPGNAHRVLNEAFDQIAYATESQCDEIAKLFKAVGLPAERQKKALADRGADAIYKLRKEAASDLIGRLNSVKAAIEAANSATGTTTTGATAKN